MGNISNRPTGGGGGIPLPHASTHTAGRSDSLPWGDIHGYGLSTSRPIASVFNSAYLYFQTDTLELYRSNGSSWDLITQSGGSIGYGLLADRPSATALNEGSLYYGTDAYLLYRSNGVSWDSLWNEASNVIYSNGTYPLLDNVKKALDQLLTTSGSAFLTATQVGFGDTGGLLSGNSLFTYDKALITGGLTIANTTEASSSITGSLILGGGLGVAKSLYVGIRTGTATKLAGFDANGKLIETTNSPGDAPLTTTQVGYGNVLNLMVGSSLFTYNDTLTTGGLTIANTTESTNSTTGALIVSGGLGVGGNAHFVGKVRAKEASSTPIDLDIDSISSSRIIGANNVFSGTGTTKTDVFGNNNTITRTDALGTTSICVGSFNYLNQFSNSVMLGLNCLPNNTPANNSVFIGSIINTGASNDGVHIGMGVSVSGASSVTIGRSAISLANSIVIGRSATANTGSSECILIGRNAIVANSCPGSVCMGGGGTTTIASSVTGTYGIAVGIGSVTGARSAARGIAIGGNSVGNAAATTAADAIALGAGSIAGHVFGIALGHGSTTVKANQIVLGNAINHTEVFIPTTTVSTSTITGALVVSGGVGIAKELYVGIRTGTATKYAGFDADGKLIETSSSVVNLVRFFGATIGDGLANPISITHSLGTVDLAVTVKNVSTGNIEYPTVKVVNSNTITVGFSIIPTLNQYRVAIFGGY